MTEQPVTHLHPGCTCTHRPADPCDASCPVHGTAWPAGKTFGELTAAQRAAAVGRAAGQLQAELTAAAPAIAAVLEQDDPPAAIAQVTIRMTPAQEESYAREYGLEPHEVARDVDRRMQHDLPVILSGEYWLAEFTTVTVSDPT